MRQSDPIPAAIHSRLAALQADGRLSAWSLIVSFMGDAMAPRGGVAASGALQALMARLGIGHGAVRTALSRLAADGWIERTREGRNSFYRLSAGVTETVLAAERRIYAPSSLLPAATPRCLVIAPAPQHEAVLDALDGLGALQFASEAWLCFSTADALPAALRQSSATLAEAPSLHPGAAMRAEMALARQAGEMARLLAAYRPVAAALEAGPLPGALDAMALRCLMIHEWRRLALRVLPIPADLLQPDDPEPETRALVAAIYARLLPPSEAWLDAHAAMPTGPLPPPDARLGSRFTGV